MKILNSGAMSSAIKEVVSLCGIEVLADANMFQAAIRDFMFSNTFCTEQQLLIFSVKIGIGEELLKATKDSVTDRKRVLLLANDLLTVEYGFLQSRSDSILEAFSLALGWSKADAPKSIRSSPDSQKPKSIVTSDDHEGKQRFVKGAVVSFGNYQWRVLYVRENLALLLSDEITDIGIPYNRDLRDVSWRESSLRVWLNSEFLNRFSPAQQKKILSRQIRAENNPWYDTDAGKPINDKVFLLSITEVVRNLGNSGQLRARPKHLCADGTSQCGLVCSIDDKYNKARIATYKDETTWWWLRSPGDSKSKAAYVNADGVIFLNGELVADDGGTSCVGVRPGVRPAIWIQQ
jgi:hypothetical protein